MDLRAAGALTVLGSADTITRVYRRIPALATFEELSDQLFHGDTAPQRIEAAEALSKLDDSRVAPTLARALADPDAEVRQRVEGLLALFARGDRAGNLEPLH
jgi:HEAT repeat protein